MTIEYYQQNAEHFFSSTINVDMGEVYRLFLEEIPKGSIILDAGCGSGRDSKFFSEIGYRVDAFDASEEMVRLARQYTNLPVAHMMFNEVNGHDKYDGIWCCASLLHVPHKDLHSVMNLLTGALKPGGIGYVSFKYGSGERVKDGRHFTDLNEKSLKVLISSLKEINIIRQWVTEDKRPERNELWLNAILKKNQAKNVKT